MSTLCWNNLHKCHKFLQDRVMAFLQQAAQVFSVEGPQHQALSVVEFQC